MASSSSQYSESFSTNKQLQKHLNKMRTIKCGLCSATFKERGALKAHQFTHGKTKQYECAVCSLKCRNPGDLKTHLKIHINDRQVKCKETSCKLLFITKGLMLSHWRATHLKMKIVKCSVCGHLSTSRSNLKRHMRTHTKERPFKCTLCEATFAGGGELDRHMRRHLGRTSFTCCFCDKKFVDRKDHDEHQKIHTRNAKFKCHLCQSSFNTEKYLCVHYSKVHSTKPPVLTCRFCQQEFGTRFQWAYHELRHTGWKYYKCLKCDREYLEASGFASHADGKYKTDCPGATGMTKKERKTFFNQCKKNMEEEHAQLLGNVTNFDEDSQIKKLGAPVYKCRFCQMEQNSKFQWAHHELRHTGWKYYKCPKCDWEASECSGFMKHIRGEYITDCTGIQGMNKQEQKEFREKSRKNWESEHARIIGEKTGRKLNELTRRSGFRRVLGASGDKTQKSTKTCQNEKDSRDMSRQPAELKHNHNTTCSNMMDPKVKECRVVLKRLNIISVTN